MQSYQALYEELLYAVQSKHPGESRHETALRYIREREQGGSAMEGSSGVAERDCVLPRDDQSSRAENWPSAFGGEAMSREARALLNGQDPDNLPGSPQNYWVAEHDYAPRAAFSAPEQRDPTDPCAACGVAFNKHQPSEGTAVER